MFKHILVPLDGSVMSEAALPVAALLAQRTGAALTLIHVVEKNAPSAVHNDRHLVTAEEATAYLDALTTRPPLGDSPWRRMCIPRRCATWRGASPSTRTSSPRISWS